MARILLLLIIVFLIYLLFRGFLKSQVKKDATPPSVPPKEGEVMITCARCGVNMPRSAARAEGALLVCDNNPQCH